MALQYFYNPAEQQVEAVEPFKYSNDSLTVRRFLLDDHQRTFTHKEFAKACARWVSLESWYDALEVLAEYRRDLTSLMVLINVQSDNEELFGPKESLQVVYTDKAFQIGLGIQLDALRKAVGMAGITANGEIIKYGTFMSARRFVEQTREWSVKALLHLRSTDAADALETQWKTATDHLFAELESICPPVMDTPSVQTLYSVSKVLKLLEISQTTLNRYRSGKVPAGYPPFPTPDRYKGRSPLWSSRSIFTWANSKTN